MSEEAIGSAFRSVPRTGVIYVTTEAAKRGFRTGDPDWCNLGQGQPETGDAARRAAARRTTIAIDVDDQEYAPVAGLWELREAIAGLYNRLYRRGMPSQYTRRERVRLGRRARGAHARGAASLGHINLGHFLPDYTAYEELLDIFKAFTADPDPARGRARLRVHRRRPAARGPRPRAGGAAAVEPVQPDRQARAGRGAGALGARSRASSTARCSRRVLLALHLDAAPAASCRWRAPRATSRTSNRDPVVLFDGLTKNWRYPGWRVTWTVGPQAGDRRGRERRARFLDGGGSKPLQRAAIPLLDDEHVVARDRGDPRRVPREARPHARRPGALGVRIDRAPDGTFYVWGNVGGLPAAAQRRHGLLPRRARAARSSSCRASSSTSTRASGAASAPRASATTCASRSARRWHSLDAALARLATLIG